MQSFGIPKSAIQNNEAETPEDKNIEIAQTESCLLFESVDFFGYERKSVFYQFFVFIEDIIKLHYWRQIYYILQYVIPVFQLFALSFYPYMPDKWNTQPGESGYSCCKFIHGLSCILTLSTPDKVSDFYLPSFIAISAISGMIIIVTVLCFLYYIFNSHSIPLFLPLLSFNVQILLYIFYFPSISAFTTSFSGLIEQTSINIFAFVYLLIVIIFFSSFLYFCSSLINFESSPNRSLFASYDGRHIHHSFMNSGLFFILVSLTRYLPSWIIYFVITMKIILTILLIYEIFSFPFVHFYTNVFSVSFYCMSITSDIIFYFDKISPFIRLFVPLTVLVFSFLSFTIIFNLIKKHILLILDILNNTKMTEIEREEFLRQNVNPKTVIGAYQFLRLGFIFKSVQILKGKVPIYIAEKMKNIDYWISLTSIISFFPGERDNFSLCLRNLKSLFARTLVEKQRILHLMMIEQHRYLTGTNEIPQRLQALEFATNNSIALTKKFWQDISKGDLKDPMDTLDTISGEINDTKNMWIMNLHLFPNEYRFAAEYSLFLTECLGKFEDGIIWLLKASHLERGFHSAIDELFRMFVCSLPYFLHDKVVNKYGFLLVEEKNFDKTETVPDKTQQDKLEEDIENGMIEQLLSEKFFWPNLRNYLSRATSHYRPKYLSIFTTLKILSFLFVFALLITINVIYSQNFKLFQYTYDIIESFNNIRVGLSFLYSTFLLQLRNNVNYNEHKISFDPGNSSINLNNLTESLYDWINYIELNYINFFYQISKDAISGEKISLLSNKLIEENLHQYFCFFDSNETFVSKSFKTNMKSIIASSLISLQSLMYSNYSKLQNNSQFCEFNLLYPELPDSFTDVSYNYSSLTHHINSDSQRIIVIMLIVFLVFAVVVWIPLLIIPQIILQLESKRIIAAMKTVDPNAAFAASQPLTIVNENENRQNYVFQHHQNSYSSLIWLWRFLYILIILIILVSVIVSYYILHVSCEKLKTFIILDHYGSTRHGLCIEVFSLAVYKMIGHDFEYFDLSYVNSHFLRYIDQIIECSNMFIHGDDNNGMIKHSSKIERLHIDDKCEASYGDANYYECMSFQRALSAFIVLAKEAMMSDYDGYLESAKFRELFHVMTADIDAMNRESRELTKNLIKSTAKKSLTVSIVLLSIATVFDIVLFIFDFAYINKLTLRMNTALLLIRHLPPPSVVETKAILDILLVETEDHKDQTQASINDVIFNAITSPTLIIGEGNIIEKVNSSFQNTFGLAPEKVVGHDLNFFIPQNEEDEGSLHLFEMMLKIQDGEVNDEPFSLVTKCISNEQDENHNDVMLSVNVTVFSVHDKDDLINGFVILVDDKSRTANVEHQLEETKMEVKLLFNQLVPLNFKSIFRNEGNDFGYVIPKTIVVVVHINRIADILERDWEGYNSLISDLENDSKKNQPFIFLQTVYDIVYFIGGIITDKEMSELALISLEFAKSLIKTLSNKLPKNNNNKEEKRFTVSIAYGGPLIAGFFNSIDISSFTADNKSKGKNDNNSTNRLASYGNFSPFNSVNSIGSSGSDESLLSNMDNIPIFDVLGDLLIKATKMASFSTTEDIIVSSDTQCLLENDKSIIFLNGPIIDGDETYLISSNND